MLPLNLAICVIGLMNYFSCIFLLPVLAFYLFHLCLHVAPNLLDLLLSLQALNDHILAYFT
ncbi:hypothetical protein ACJX0J_038371, partial [Zea mays]